jgi:undecaprenyl-diphosphatase
VTPIHLLILSLAQGLSEFLPVSSTGHLNLLQSFFGQTPSLSLDVFLNTATLFSVLYFFRGQIKFFLANLNYIIVGTLPAAVFGLLFRSQFEVIYSRPDLLPLFFLITSLLVFLTKLLKNHHLPLNYPRAFIIGLFQALAILPGVSRSAATIFAALLLGLSSENAFKFSFSLFIPASLGALFLDARRLAWVSLAPLSLFSFLLAFFSGILALHLLYRFLTSRRFWYFSIYTFILSLALFTFLRS